MLLIYQEGLKNKMTNSEYQTQLQKYRSVINDLDIDLLQILSKRFVTTNNIGILKQKHQIEVIDIERQQAHKQNLCLLAKKYNLDPIFISELFELIMKKSVNEQQKLK